MPDIRAMRRMMLRSCVLMVNMGVVVTMRDLFGSGVAPQVLALTWVAASTYAVGTVLLAAYVFSREWALMRGV